MFGRFAHTLTRSRLTRFEEDRSTLAGLAPRMRHYIWADGRGALAEGPIDIEIGRLRPACARDARRVEQRELQGAVAPRARSAPSRQRELSVRLRPPLHALPPRRGQLAAVAGAPKKMRADPRRCRTSATRCCVDAGRRNRRSRQTSDRIFLGDRKSTRLNSSHGSISYAVFCL